MTDRAHILVVDDEPDLVAALAIRLGRAGYRVSTACDGLGAVAAVLADDPDLVVLDLAMPVMDGHAVLERLRGLERSRPLPVLCLSARTGSDDRSRAEAAGATMFVTKPFDGAGFLGAVDALLAAPGALRQSAG
jgi:two-component system KDP operon response regulator KdpE